MTAPPYAQGLSAGPNFAQFPPPICPPWGVAQVPLITPPAAAGGATPTLVRQNVGSGASSANATVSITPTTAGNFIIAFYARSGGLSTGALTSVTDSASQTWSVATRGAVSGGTNTRIECWYIENSASISSVTFNSATAQTNSWNILEFSGVATSGSLDVISPDNSASASSTTVTTPTITTLTANDLVLAACHYGQAATTTYPGSPWTNDTDFDDAAAGSGRVSHQVLGTPGPVSASWVQGTAHAAGVITVAFKAGAGGGANNFTQSFTAGLGLAGLDNQLVQKIIPPATVGFTGADQQFIQKIISAALSWTGFLDGTKVGTTDPVFRAAATVTTNTGGANSSITGNLASTTVGDINILCLDVSSNNVTTADPGVPTINGSSIAAAGWNLIDSSVDTAAANTPRLTWAWRIFQSGDASSITWAWTGSVGNSAAGGIAYQTGTFNPTTPFPTDGHAMQTQASSLTTFTTPSVTTTERGLLLSVFGNRTAGTWSADTGDTKRLDGYSSSAANFALCDAPTAVGAGTYSKTGTFTVATSVGNQGIALLASKLGGANNFSQTLTAALSFTGLDTNAILHMLTAALTFTGVSTRLIPRLLTAVLSFTTASSRSTRTTRAAALNLSGTQSLRTSHGATASVGFTGSQTRAITRGLLAALSLTGALPKRTVRALTATLGFAGSLSSAAVHHFTQALTATLAFTGALPRNTGSIRTATVGFTGAQTRAAGHGLAAVLGFTTAQPRRTSSGQAANLTFTGSRTSRTARALTATISFTGTWTNAAVHHFTQTLTASVGFTGSLTTAAVHRFTQALSATLAFIGSQTRATNRPVNASVAFTGSQTRSTRRISSASLVMTGAASTRTSSHLSAALTLTGSLPRRTTRALAAAVSFTGAVVAGRTFGRVLTATVGFTVQSFRRTQPRLAATLSNTGNLARTIRTRLVAALGFTVSYTLLPHLVSALNNLRIRMSGRENRTAAHGTEEPPRTLAGRRPANTIAGTEPDVTVAVQFTKTMTSGTEEGT